MKTRSHRRVGSSLGAALVLLAGCYAPVQMTASNRPVTELKTLGKRVDGWSCQYHLFGALPVSGGNTIRAAIEDAKEKAKADTLVEVTVDRRNAWFLLASSSCTLVSGVPVHG